jgi:hypothetical protein
LLQVGFQLRFLCLQIREPLLQLRDALAALVDGVDVWRSFDRLAALGTFSLLAELLCLREPPACALQVGLALGASLPALAELLGNRLAVLVGLVERDRRVGERLALFLDPGCELREVVPFFGEQIAGVGDLGLEFGGILALLLGPGFELH